MAETKDRTEEAGQESDSSSDQIRANVLLGVSGGIAAYKAVDLASKLTGRGACVRVVMTACACELVGPVSFEAVTGNAVLTSMWERTRDDRIQHISLMDWADIVVVAPATANIIGKTAGGICDDLLSTTLCAAWGKPCLMAPAMNDRMWSNPAVQRNVVTVREMGFELVGPAAGRLACGTKGVGRMAEPSEILEAIARIAKGLKTD